VDLFINSELEELCLNSPKVPVHVFSTVAKTCAQLTRLDLSSSHIDVQLSTITINNPGLQWLNLEECLEIKKPALLDLCLRLTSLTNLFLGGISVIDEDVCKHIGNNLSELVHIDLGLSSVSDVGIQYVVQGCKKLEIINLSGCSQLHSIALESIVSNLPKLTSLNLSWTDTIDSIQALTQLSGLKDLSLTGIIDTINPAHFGAIINANSKLCHLRLASVSFVNHQNLELIANLKHLEYLVLADCKFSEQHSPDLLSLGRCKSLTFLDLGGLKCSSVIAKLVGELPILDTLDLEETDVEYDTVCLLTTKLPHLSVNFNLADQEGAVNNK